MGCASGRNRADTAWATPALRVDPATHRVTVSRPLALAVHDASGAALAGSAYVFGGGAATTVATVQQWTARGGRRVAALPAPRSDSAAAVVGGTAYVVGGFDGRGMTRDVLATTDGRVFRKVARLAIGVRYPAVAAVGGAVSDAGVAVSGATAWLVGGETSGPAAPVATVLALTSTVTK